MMRRCAMFVLTCAALLLGTRAALAHDSSVTRIHAIVSADAVEITFNFNQADVLHFVLNEPSRHTFLDDAEAAAAIPPLTDYLMQHVELRIDGKITTPEILPHPQATPATIPLTLRWPVTGNASKATLMIDLFDRSGFAPLFEISSESNGVANPRLEYLRPGNTFTFDLPRTATRPSAAVSSESPQARTWWETALQFVGMGFTHIVPNGLDHILFVIGLFFLSPKLKPLLEQVTAFTVAHSITLALSVLGVVSLPSRIVEPLIAISITAVALENIFTRRVHPWRWAIVFGFGLIHGLGFAGILRETSLPSGGVATALVSFNVGVELGQLTVIAALFAVTYWIQNRAWYFRYVAAPVSILIAAIGLFWTVQRVFEF